MSPAASIKIAIKRTLHELGVHAQRAASRSTGPRCLWMPSNQPWDPASNLRAWLLAPELGRLGWRSIVVPATLSLRQRRRIVRAEKPDVIVLQQSRNAMNRPKLFAPVPCVFDADDADYLDPACKDVVIECSRESRAVIAGSRFIAECLGRHNADTSIVWTSTPAPPARARTRPDEREPIVAWAHGNPLSYPAEANLVREVMTEVARRTPCEFWLFGTREEDAREYLQPIRDAGAIARAFSSMDYADYLATLEQAAVGLQPVCTENEFSRGKSFGKVLAYLAGEVAVVASDEVDHPLFFEHGRNGFLVRDRDQWVNAIQVLLEDKALRRSIAEHAYASFRSRLTTSVAAELVDAVLRRAIGERGAAAGPTVRDSANGLRPALERKSA